MGSSRRLALLASRAWTAARPRSELASGALAARARGFAAVPATNDDDYKRLKAAKSSITVRTRRVRRVVWQACCGARRAPTPHVRLRSLAADAGRTVAAAQWPEMCNKPLAAVDPEMARNRGAAACAHVCGA